MKPVPRWLVMSGAVLCFGGPFIGFFTTVWGVIYAFHTLGEQGISDPATLSHHIGTALVATASGLVVAVGGVILMIAGFITHHACKKDPLQSR